MNISFSENNKKYYKFHYYCISVIVKFGNNFQGISCTNSKMTLSQNTIINSNQFLAIQNSLALQYFRHCAKIFPYTTRFWLGKHNPIS